MLINVAQLQKEPVGSSRTVDLDEQIGQKNNNACRVKGTVTLTHINKGVLAQGNLVSYMKGICSRCLTPVEQQVEFDLEEEFLPTIDVDSGLPAAPSEDAFTIDNRHNIELSEALYQNTLLAMPMKVLCKSDCRGICSICGQNLNTGPCQCQAHIQSKRRYKQANTDKIIKGEHINGTSTQKKIR
jgi:uncharacterized protein